MRRLNDISIQMDDRWTNAAPPPRGRRARATRRPPLIRWTGALRRPMVRHAVLAGVALLGLLVGVALFPAQKVAARLLAWSGRAGFRVEDIYVEGRVKTPRDQLLTALAVNRGDAILGVDLAQARHRLEEIPWVRSAVVERRLPNLIQIVITERSPIALWQNKGRYFLVDRDGQIVGDQIDDYADLPLTVGEGAPDHAADLIAILASEPSLRARVKAAQWVGERRWNITLDRAPDGIEIRLPEETAMEAWHDLARLENEQKLLERQISVVDMRLPDRLVLRAEGAPREPADGHGKHKSANGKDA